MSIHSNYVIPPPESMTHPHLHSDSELDDSLEVGEDFVLSPLKEMQQAYAAQKEQAATAATNTHTTTHNTNAVVHTSASLQTPVFSRSMKQQTNNNTHQHAEEVGHMQVYHLHTYIYPHIHACYKDQS